jgi:hypothetical protein
MDEKLAPIHSKKDLAEYLKVTIGLGSPLNVLPPTKRKSFLSSLVFAHGGLAGYSYRELEHLKPMQAYQILALFGVQRDTRMITSTESSQSTCIFGIDPGCGGPPGEVLKDFKCYWANGHGTCDANTGTACDTAYCH